MRQLQQPKSAFLPGKSCSDEKKKKVAATFAATWSCRLSRVLQGGQKSWKYFWLRQLIWCAMHNWRHLHSKILIYCTKRNGEIGITPSWFVQWIPLMVTVSDRVKAVRLWECPTRSVTAASWTSLEANISRCSARNNQCICTKFQFFMAGNSADPSTTMNFHCTVTATSDDVIGCSKFEQVRNNKIETFQTNMILT